MPGVADGSVNRNYIDFMRNTGPVLYVSFQGGKIIEAVRNINATVTGAGVRDLWKMPGNHSVVFDGANDSVVIATNAAYHPGDTFSCGGWFERLGAGDTGSGGPVMINQGANDFTIWFPAGTNAGRIVLRKSGVGDIFATSTTNWGSPYTRGVHHILFTKTGATTVCYVDGVSDAGGGTTSNQTIVAATADVSFGLVSGASTLDFHGRLAHWATWNRVLTAGEVLGIYLAGLNQT